MSFGDAVGIASSIDQLFGTAIGVIDRVRTTYVDQKLHDDVYKNRLRELESTRNTITIVREEDALQTAHVVATLGRLQSIEKQLNHCLQKADRSDQGTMQRFGHELLYGKAERGELDEITKEIVRVKTDLCLSVQLAHVGLARKEGSTILVNREDVRQMSAKLEEHLGPGNGLRMSRLLRNRPTRPDGLVEVSEDDLASVSSSETLQGSEPQKLEQIIMGNVTKDTAHQINGPIGDKQWLGLARLVIKNNRAEGNAVQINHSIDTDSFAAMLQARQKMATKVAAAQSRSSATRK